MLHEIDTASINLDVEEWYQVEILSAYYEEDLGVLFLITKEAKKVGRQSKTTRWVRGVTVDFMYLPSGMGNRMVLPDRIDWLNLYNLTYVWDQSMETTRPNDSECIDIGLSRIRQEVAAVHRLRPNE